MSPKDGFENRHGLMPQFMNLMKCLSITICLMMKGNESCDVPIDVKVQLYFEYE